MRFMQHAQRSTGGNRSRRRYRVSPSASALEKLKLDSAEQQAGVNIVRRSLEEPIRQIVQNAGYEGSIVVDKVRNNSSSNFGCNALAEQVEDLVAAGVIDPTKVSTLCASERGQYRVPDAHHRSNDYRKAERGRIGSGWSRSWRRRNARNGRNGRNDVNRPVLLSWGGS